MYLSDGFPVILISLCRYGALARPGLRGKESRDLYQRAARSMTENVRRVRIEDMVLQDTSMEE